MHHFKQYFWTIEVGTGDIGSKKRIQIAKAAHSLHVLDDFLLATSAGGRTTDEAPEISLTYAAGRDPSTLAPVIEKALAEHGLEVKAVLQSENHRSYHFDEEQLDNFSAFSEGGQDTAAVHALIEELHSLPTGIPAADVAANIELPHVENSAPPFSVIPSIYDKLKSATGDDIEKQMKGLENTFTSISRETNSNAVVTLMVASGMVTVGKLMWSAYLQVKAAGSLATLVAGLVGAVTVAKILIAIAVLVAAILAILALKDAKNVLLVANASSSIIDYTNEFIINGESDVVVDSIPAYAPARGSVTAVYPCGFYEYQKNRILEQPTGFYGSCFGVTLTSKTRNSPFSIGMDCPNTPAGGTNSIYIIAGNHAEDVAKKANDGNGDSGSVQLVPGRASCKRSSPTGNINWAFCWVEN